MKDNIKDAPRFIAIEEVDRLIEKAVDRVLERVELSQLSYFVYLIPVVSVLFAWVILGETINLQQAFFAGLLISGVAVAQRDVPQTAATVVGAPVPEGPPGPPCEDGDEAPKG